MSAYYNENDPFAAEWLRALISAGHIAPGDVDERSIVDVSPDDVLGYEQCHWFAGIGGWSYALRLAGWDDSRPVWTGSCPCQPFSTAGKGRGTADARHLWPDLCRLIGVVQPSVCFGEQVASKDGREWLSGVRADLEAMGYAVGAADLCAAGVGAPHIRQRLWWVADSQSGGAMPAQQPRQRDGTLGNSEAIWVAESKITGVGRHCRDMGSEDETSRISRNRRADGDVADCCSTDGGVADSETRRRGEVDSHGSGSNEGSGAERRERPEYCSISDGMGNTDDPRPQGRVVSECERPGKLSAWSPSMAIKCRDGKTRQVPTQPAFFPLADGLPAGRVGVLRGAGNAIVPQVAAEFVRAWMEVSNTQQTKHNQPAKH